MFWCMYSFAQSNSTIIIMYMTLIIYLFMMKQHFFTLIQ